MLLTHSQVIEIFNRHGLLVSQAPLMVVCNLILRLELDRSAKCFVLTVSSWNSFSTDDYITASEKIDPILGLHTYQIHNIAGDIYLSQTYWNRFAEFATKVYATFHTCDFERMTLHLSLSKGGFFAIDEFSIWVDDNALFRQNILAPTETTDMDAIIYLDGQIACIGNGAAILMASMDNIIEQGQLAEIRPHSFTELDDVQLLNKLEAIILAFANDVSCKGILLNCFCTFFGCDEIAEKLLQIYRSHPIAIHTAVHFDGLHVDEGFLLLANAKNEKITTNRSLYGAVEDVVKIAKGQ